MSYANRFFSVAIIILMVAVSSTAFAVELPDSVKVQVLELKAAGNFAAADSVEKSFMAKVELEQMQIDAAAELEKLQSEACKNTYAKWSQEITPMPYDSVWAWVEVEDTTTDLPKSVFLAERYNVDYDSTMKYYEIVSVVKTEVEFRQKIDSRVAKKCGGSNAEVAALKKQVDELVTTVNNHRNFINDNTVTAHDAAEMALINAANIDLMLKRLTEVEIKAAAALYGIDFMDVNKNASKKARNLREKLTAQVAAKHVPLQLKDEL